MNSKLVSVLASVCIVLILIIIGEWFYAVRAQKQTLNSTISTETKISHDEMPEIELTRQPEESYADLVTRPLFIKGRKPVDEPSSGEEQTIATANHFDWQLNGVYTTKKGLSALFSRSASKVPKDKYRKISTGADLDGWKLTEIHKDRAILKQGDQQKELLLRKPKLKNLTNMSNMPKSPNVPNISNSPNVPNISNSPQPAEGEFENSNEHL
jgi:hypothetical protein